MKLGTQTGSLINHVLTTAAQAIPAVGDAATICGWSDRYPATVVSVERRGKAHLVRVQEDHYKRIDTNGMSESQEYEYAPNPTGHIVVVRIWDNGKSEEVHLNHYTGRLNKSGPNKVRFGIRQRYYDYSF